MGLRGCIAGGNWGEACGTTWLYGAVVIEACGITWLYGAVVSEACGITWLYGAVVGEACGLHGCMVRG